MDLNQCTYRVTGKARASLVVYCSKAIEGWMIEDLVPAKVMGLSSTYCGVVEDDVEIIWENDREINDTNFFRKYDSDNDEPETMNLKAFNLELSLSFMAVGIEVDSETFLDNLYISVDFMESIYESVYSDSGFEVRILEGKIEPFEFELTVL
jgi:hypothetical protein